LNRAEGACLFFCGLYLLYWAVVHGMPRFAIAPILILQVLTAGRVIALCRAVPPLIRFSLYAASSYALLFGLLGAAIIEVNAPQLRYFAKRIDKTEYLRETLLPYRALEFVRNAAHTGDAVLSIESCPLVYAPNPSLFDCAWPSGREPGSLVEQRHYHFLILPVSRAANVPGRWREVYRDESYLVYVPGSVP